MDYCAAVNGLEPTRGPLREWTRAVKRLESARLVRNTTKDGDGWFITINREGQTERLVIVEVVK